MIIRININKFFADKEHRTECERSTQGLMVSVFEKESIEKLVTFYGQPPWPSRTPLSLIFCFVL